MAGGTPTPSSGGGFGGSTSRPFGPTGTGTATGTRAASFPSVTGPFNGDGDLFDSTPSVNLGKAVGIPVGIILGVYVIVAGIVIAVYMTRQKNRKAWYGPTAKFYRDGGRMGEAGAAAPLLGAGHQSPNPFTTPSPTVTPASAGAPYQPTQFQAPQAPQMGQYDPNVAAYGGPGYPQNNAYYDPNATYSPQPVPQPGSTHHVPQV